MRSNVCHLLFLFLSCNLVSAASNAKGKEEDDPIPVEEFVSPLDYFVYMNRPGKATKDVNSPIKSKKKREKKAKKKTKERMKKD